MGAQNAEVAGSNPAPLQSARGPDSSWSGPLALPTRDQIRDRNRARPSRWVANLAARAVPNETGRDAWDRGRWVDSQRLHRGTVDAAAALAGAKRSVAAPPGRGYGSGSGLQRQHLRDWRRCRKRRGLAGRPARRAWEGETGPCDSAKTRPRSATLADEREPDRLASVDLGHSPAVRNRCDDLETASVVFPGAVGGWHFAWHAVYDADHEL